MSVSYLASNSFIPPVPSGLSLEAQDKLIDLVDGRGLQAAGGGGRLKWPNMRSLLNDLHSTRKYDLTFGPNVAEPGFWRQVQQG